MKLMISVARVKAGKAYTLWKSKPESRYFHQVRLTISKIKAGLGTFIRFFHHYAWRVTRVRKTIGKEPDRAPAIQSTPMRLIHS